MFDNFKNAIQVILVPKRERFKERNFEEIMNINSINFSKLIKTRNPHIYKQTQIQTNKKKSVKKLSNDHSSIQEKNKKKRCNKVKKKQSSKKKKGNFSYEMCSILLAWHYTFKMTYIEKYI